MPRLNSHSVHLAFLAFSFAAFANADTFSFSFAGGPITSSGTITATHVADGTSGVATPGTFEITAITGTFADTSDGISGAITGLYTPISYTNGLTGGAAFTAGGVFSYDDLLFPSGNSPKDCPGAPNSGGPFDVYGVAFNLAGGDIGEFFSNGNFGNGPLVAAVDGNATGILDDPNYGSDSLPQGIIGTFTSVPEPNSLFFLGSGLAVAVLFRFRRASSAKQ
jgi:hypothetical protein